MLTFTVLLLAAAPPQPVAVPPQAEILESLRREHPRLIVLPADLERVKGLISDDPRAAAVYEAVKRRADDLLRREDTVRYHIIGPRLLRESRKCLDRVYTLASVYRVDGDRRYASRAAEEMLAAAAFRDWNPSHFLDTAEMTHALAVGYDWLYDFLSPEDRQTIRRAIVDKGLHQAEEFYRDGKWWARCHHNWNQVCNGGIALGALAVAEDEPDLAAYIVAQAARSVQLAMKQFAPDGAWAEGPGYWNYATRYNVYMLAGLESALGTDFGLSRFPGFSATGDFRVHFVGPTKRTFNFADGSSGVGRAAQMFWFSRRFNRPLYAWHERDYVGGVSALHLWWFDPRGGPPEKLPTARWFRNADVVFMRSQWNDPRAVFVGFKGGDNKANHSHLELGSFVMDADGQRWALDLGPDNYNLPGYFGNKRWTYYRLATRGQNTLMIDGKNQDPRAAAPIVAFRSTPRRTHAVADLSDAYANQATGVRRGIALVGRRVLVQDELEGTEGAEVTWQMHTRAEIRLDGDRALLRQDGESLLARILSPAGGRFVIESANPPPPERQQPEVRKLAIKLAGRRAELVLAVLFSPAGTAAGDPLELLPLSDWGSEPMR